MVGSYEQRVAGHAVRLSDIRSSNESSRGVIIVIIVVIIIIISDPAQATSRAAAPGTAEE